MVLKKIQKGSALYFAIIVIAILFSMALALNIILIRQIKVTKKIADSIITFYAADAGWEAIMNSLNTTNTVFSGQLGGAEYKAIRMEENQTIPVFGTCYPDSATTTQYCIISIGEYKGLERKIFMRH